MNKRIPFSFSGSPNSYCYRYIYLEHMNWNLSERTTLISWNL